MPEDSAPAGMLLDGPVAAGWIGTDPPPRGEAVRRLIEANNAASRESALPEDEAMRRLLALEALHALDRARISGLQQRVAEFEASTSWRLTAPVRWAGGFARRTRARLRPSAAPAGEPALPRTADAAPGPLSYREWITAHEPAIVGELTSFADRPAPGQLGLALLVRDPLPAGAGPLLRELAADAAEEGWRVLLLCPAETAPCPVLAQLASTSRAELLPLPASAGSGRAWQLALDHLDTTMVALLDVCDRVTPGALRILGAAFAQDPRLDLIFADEDRLDGAGERTRPFFKPGWDPVLARVRDGLPGALALHRADLMRAVLAAPDAPACPAAELSRRAALSARPDRIRHVPAVLCHRIPAAEYRFGPPPLPATASVCIIASARGAVASDTADSLLRATDYAALEVRVAASGGGSPAALNAAAAATTADVLVFLDADARPLDPGWLAALVEAVAEPGVGAAGAKLLMPDGRIWSAGLTPDVTGTPRHLLHGAADSPDGDPFGVLAWPHCVWAASLRCLAVRRSAFTATGGLNDRLPVRAGEVDLCLRLAAHDYRVAWTPAAAVAVSAADDPFPPEARERLARDWGRLLLHDPYRNANLCLENGQLRLRRAGADRRSPSAPSPAPAFPVALSDAVQDARIAAAQARRDRNRLIEAQAEIARLREQAGRIWALRGVARRAGRLLPAPLHAARGAALVIDDHWPRVDRDSGSVDIDNLLTALADLGFDLTFLALQEPARSSPARERLEARGVRCVAARDAADAESFLARHGGAVDLCVLCRAFSGGAVLQAARDHCGKARLVFNTIDLNYVREQRRAVLTGDKRLAELAQWAQQREEDIIRACDATLVVSTAELELLAHTMPDAFVVQMPLARPIRPPAAPFAARSGIGFIGGFAHAPNVDAVRSFLADTWPLVLRHLPDCTFSIVGADFPSDLLEGVVAVSQVRALGHVADVGPWFESLRLTIAPLRYGAGAKGKVASSLAAGVPCVASPVAAEGMQLQDGSGVLVAADPQTFADHVRDLHNDAALWASLSERAQAYARRTLSLDAWRDRLDAALLRLGL